MIYLYSGTPGSGKSLHVARVIYYSLMRNMPVICNFPINQSFVRHPDMFRFIDNTDLRPDELMQISRDYFGREKVKEGSLLLVIDECQMMFNARSWDKKDREGWNKFFQIHRHFGFDVILVAQFDRMIDRQIRSLIEYEQIHRKVSNFGVKGKFLCALLLSPHLFVAVKVWYPMKEKVGSEFFKATKRYYRLYDTYMLFDDETQKADAAVLEAGEQGAPASSAGTSDQLCNT